MLIVSKIFVKITAYALKHVGLRKGSEGGSLQLVVFQEEMSESYWLNFLHVYNIT